MIQRNGDPASDLLYSLGFAFLGLQEAFTATGDPRIADVEDRLAEFLVRIQTTCTVHPELPGIWMRSFDTRSGSTGEARRTWAAAPSASRQDGTTPGSRPCCQCAAGDNLLHTGRDDSMGELLPAILDEVLKERPFIHAGRWPHPRRRDAGSRVAHLQRAES